MPFQLRGNSRRSCPHGKPRRYVSALIPPLFGGYLSSGGDFYGPGRRYTLGFGGDSPPTCLRCASCHRRRASRALSEAHNVLFLAYGSAAAHLFHPPVAVSRDSLLLEAKRHTKQFERSGRLRVRASRQFRARADFAHLGPAQKIRILASGAALPRALQRFVEDVAHANLLKKVRGSLPGIAYAFRCYTDFCEVANAPSPFPLRRRLSCVGAVFSTIHPHSGTIYRAVQKACFPAAASRMVRPICPTIGQRAKKSKNRILPFSNFTRIQETVAIYDRESPIVGCARDSFLSFLVSFRVPSGAPHLRRAYSAGDLAAFSPHPDKSLISVRTIDIVHLLVAKQARRKNLPGGCILRRPCFFGLTSLRAQHLCPVRTCWALIRCRVAPGAPLFPSVNRRNFNRSPNAIMAQLGIPEAHRYSSHGFRRGTTQELKDPGSPWSVAATSGMWHSSAFRGMCICPSMLR